jgi:hypothetical protein
MRNAVLTLAMLAVGTSPALAQGWAEKMFKDGLTHDFGTVPRGAQLFHRFTITNIYAVRMDITAVSAGCNCVTATAAKKSLEPRESTTIDILMDAKRFTGSKSVGIRVTVGPEFVSSAELKVTANSRADVVFNPGEVGFGSVTRGQTVTQSIDVEYAGALKWEINEVVVGKDLPFQATAKEWYRRPGQVGYKVQVTLKTDVPLGPLKEYFYLKTNDPASPTVPVLVEGVVQSALTVTPGSLNLGAVTVGDTLTRRVLVKGAKPFKVLSLDASGDDITLVPSADTAAAVQTVTFKCQFTKPGEFKRELKIKTDLQDAPVIVLLEGNVTK